MTLEKKIARTFHLEGDAWMKHANPWSVWTRFITLPFLILAVWSRVWIGWYCLIPVVLLIIWLRINPTLFKKPAHYNHWGAKAVLGEKYWSERKKIPVPAHHTPVIHMLTGLQFLGAIILIVGLWTLHFSLTLIGAIVIYFAKMWFLDRMVWIFEERKSTPALRD